jgi:hypothetical protein
MISFLERRRYHVHLFTMTLSSPRMDYRLDSVRVPSFVNRIRKFVYLCLCSSQYILVIIIMRRYGSRARICVVQGWVNVTFHAPLFHLQVGHWRWAQLCSGRVHMATFSSAASLFIELCYICCLWHDNLWTCHRSNVLEIGVMSCLETSCRVMDMLLLRCQYKRVQT